MAALGLLLDSALCSVRTRKDMEPLLLLSFSMHYLHLLAVTDDRCIPMLRLMAILPAFEPAFFMSGFRMAGLTAFMSMKPGCEASIQVCQKNDSLEL